MRKLLLTLILSILIIMTAGCAGDGDPTTPSGDNPDLRVTVSRLFPENTKIEMVSIEVTRLEDGKMELPGRNIQILASSGDVSAVTDHGDGTYGAIWSGDSGDEVTLTVTDLDSEVPVTTSITFIAMDYLLSKWDVPIKLADPVSTDGWEAGAFMYPTGDRIAFAYITLDIVALAADITRSIGEERPGQSFPQTFDIYVADNPDFPESISWWTGWGAENVNANKFQALPMHLAAPSVTSDLLYGFCTIQEFNGESYTPTKLYVTGSEFIETPEPIGSPVDMTGLGEDNPYFDVTNGWLYFDTYDLGNPLSKQNLWAARSLGGLMFDDPVPLSDLNTIDIETQPFMHEPTGMLYFASDRMRSEFELAIWRASTIGDFTSNPEKVAEAGLAVGRPSISLNGEWFCFSYASLEASGADADIALCRKLED